MKLSRRTLIGMSAAAVAAPTLLRMRAANAAEVTLKLHHFLPPKSNAHARLLDPWAKKVSELSGGKVEIQIFPSMQLGGKPPELYDQAKDGVVDIIWTVIGYTPGRFPSTEAFELPFVMTNGEATSRAFHEYCEKHCADEFKDVKVIAWHTHGPGLIHSKTPVNKLEDMQGLKIRGGSRTINEMLTRLGAEPIGMPVPAVDSK